MAPKSKINGLQLLGTGDAFHPRWLDIIEESTTYSGDGIYSVEDMDFVLTSEVEGKHRIHHLIIIPDMDIARELSDKLPSKNKEIDGRPKTRYGGVELLDLVKEYDCLIGPAHAFTPWTGMYKSYDSIYDCYGKKPDFVAFSKFPKSVCTYPAKPASITIPFCFAILKASKSFSIQEFSPP